MQSIARAAANFISMLQPSPAVSHSPQGAFGVNAFVVLAAPEVGGVQLGSFGEVVARHADGVADAFELNPAPFNWWKVSCR